METVQVELPLVSEDLVILVMLLQASLQEGKVSVLEALVPVEKVGRELAKELPVQELADLVIKATEAMELEMEEQARVQAEIVFLTLLGMDLVLEERAQERVEPALMEMEALE